MHFCEQNSNDPNLDLQNRFLDTWKNFFDQAALNWSEQRLLNVLKSIRDHQGPLDQAIHRLASFGNGLEELCAVLLGYPPEIHHADGLRQRLDAYFDDQLKWIYTLKSIPMNREQQLHFLQLEAQKPKRYLRFYVRESDSFPVEEFKSQLITAHSLLGFLYYANSYQVSLMNYGYKKLSYTWLDKDYTEVFHIHSQMKICSESFEELSSPHHQYIGLSNVLAFSGIDTLIEQVYDIINGIDGHYKSGYVIARERIENDGFIKSGLAAMDIPEVTKQVMLIRLIAFGDALFQGLVSGGLVLAEMGWLNDAGAVMAVPEERLWFIRETILN